MGNLYECLPEAMNRWKQVADRSRFFGLPISTLSHGELLAVVGQLIEDKERAFKERERERIFQREVMPYTLPFGTFYCPGCRAVVRNRHLCPGPRRRSY